MFSLRTAQPAQVSKTLHQIDCVTRGRAFSHFLSHFSLLRPAAASQQLSHSQCLDVMFLCIKANFLLLCRLSYAAQLVQALSSTPRSQQDLLLACSLTSSSPRSMAESTPLLSFQVPMAHPKPCPECDGIGAEVAESVKTIFKADNVPIEWEQVDVSGVDTGNKHSEELFKESIASLRRNKLGLKGILFTPVERSGHQSFNVALRQELDIFASIVLIKNIPGYKTRHENVDLCIIRENTEGEYSGLEHQSVQGVVESLKIITRAKSERIAKFAFGFALANNRKKVTCIHKANIMKLADGLFRSTFHKVAEMYPTLEVNDMIVDNASMQAVSRPQQFDVMVMPNLYGGILSNVGAALVGGPGVVPGCNMGRDVAVFEPGCRHVGLDIKGKDQANPSAMILSGSMLLRHLGLDDHANRISKAVYDVIGEGKTRTRDMGGQATTHEFTRAVLDKMEAAL
ncbi:NAD+ isocitrate dehydrogenase subunit I [Aspergillus fumigatus]|nr:NAD+ isocitrate dehydrogenase subunit I [Aspergillus fumigatus]